MTDFVSKNCLDFLNLHLFNQSVVQYDSPELSKSGKIGIGMPRSLATVNDFDRLRLKPGFSERAIRRSFSSPSSSGDNLLNKGMINLGQRIMSNSWMPKKTTKTQTHHISSKADEISR